MKTLTGKTAVITGAGSGLGLEFAKTAARLGMNITLVDINSDSLEKAQKEISELGVKSIIVKADVSKFSDMENVAKKSEEAFGPVTLLINNAGVSSGGLVWELEDKDWQKVLGIDFYGVLYGIKAFVPKMIEYANKYKDYFGYIVNTASLAGFISYPTMGAYNAAKSAVISLSETLQAELNLVTDQIQVSVLTPGFIKTNIAKASFKPEGQVVEEPKGVTAGREMFTNFVNNSTYLASHVVESTFKAIQKGDFYIFLGDDETFSVSKKMESVMKRSYFDALRMFSPEVYQKMVDHMK